MTAAIISFALEMLFMTIVQTLGDSLTPAFSIFTVIVYILCTITSFTCIFYNSKNIKGGLIPRRVCVTGLVFSIVGTVLGLIFCITFFGTLAIITRAMKEQIVLSFSCVEIYLI